MGHQWPVLSYQKGKETFETLHMWTQIVGKIKLATLPWINHSWHITLHIVPSGLTTQIMPYKDLNFQIDFDFINDLGEWQLPFTIAFTKADKEKPGAVERNVKLFFEKMKETWQFLPQYFITSAISKQGKEEILDFINQLNKEFSFQS